VTRVVILAAGKGVNMRPFTYELPKAMIPVQDKPLVSHTIEALISAGLKDIIVVTGHLGEKIQDHFKNGAQYGANITYVQDTQENGTAQALKSVQPLVGADPFLLIYGDVLAQIDWVKLIDFHESQQPEVTMAVTTVSETKEWGMVRMEGTQVVELQEKSLKGNSSHMINSGVFVVDPHVLDLIKEKTISFEEEILPRLVREGKLKGYHFSGDWYDVGSPEDYEKVLHQWKHS
jgi:NDP-sugar pyrophosphorylase family protein